MVLFVLNKIQMKKLIVCIALLLGSLHILQAQTLKQLQGKWTLVKIRMQQLQTMDNTNLDSIAASWVAGDRRYAESDSLPFTEADSIVAHNDNMMFLNAMFSLTYNFKAGNIIVISGIKESGEAYNFKGTYVYNATTKLLTVTSKNLKGKNEVLKFKTSMQNGRLVLLNKTKDATFYMSRTQ